MSVATAEIDRKVDQTGPAEAAPADTAPAEIQKPAAAPTAQAGAAPEAQAVAAPETDENACPHCGSLEPWGRSSWCPRCGFYPVLGTWTEAHPHVDAGLPATRKPLLLMVPRWAWILLAGLMVTLGLSVGGSLLTELDGWDRTIWALIQFGIGGSLFVVAHFWSFGIAAIHSDRVGTFDFVMKPLSVWTATVKGLPQSKHRLWMGAWGFSAAVFALTIVGGIRYSAIFDDWGVKGPTDDKLVAAVRKKAEDDRKKGDHADAKANDKEAAALPQADCVIIGYSLTEDGSEIEQLVLASVVEDELRYVGAVSEGLTADVRADLLPKLQKLEREQPFVRAPPGSRWVDPVLMCRVRFKGWNEHHLLVSATFENLQAEL